MPSAVSANSECLIVGGGIIGLSLAYELACEGVRVTVADQSAVGREASWAGAGMLPPASEQAAVHPLAQLQALSHQLHPRWAERLREETGIDTGYRRCGAIYVARTAGEAASLAALALTLEEEQVRVERLAAERLVEVEPGLEPLHRAGRLKTALLLPDESQLRNPRHLRALAEACRRRGVELWENAAVEGFAISHGRLREVRTASGPLAADRVCLTAGAWTYRLMQQLDIPCGIFPVRGQMVMYQCERPPLTHIINEGTRYLVPRDDGRILIGSTEEEVGFDKSTTPEALAELRTLAEDILPSLRGQTPERCWSGLRPASFDGFPYMGKLPGLDNAFVAAGHFRAGLTLSPATAVVMSRLMRGEPPGLDLSPFRAGRG